MEMRSIVIPILLMAFAGCIAGTTTNTSRATPGEALDSILQAANAAKDEIIRKSPNPENWGELVLMEYEADYQMSGLPHFLFIDKSTIKIEDEQRITYTDLEFVLKQQQIVDIASHFRGLLTNLIKDRQYQDTVRDIASFDHPPSFYVNLALNDILRVGSPEGPIEPSDLKLAGFQYEFFARPQVIEITFDRLSTIKRSENQMESDQYIRSITPDGTIAQE